MKTFTQDQLTQLEAISKKHGGEYFPLNRFVSRVSLNNLHKAGAREAVQAEVEALGFETILRPATVIVTLVEW